ncbi:TetR/AcrR family transcriptional regulator [Nocardia cyriacigeorgica]|uniref:TetR/AcrR family transcriptional regulator n=1 Tax=Nocardia cyriacigeorgica TaxID=135487 RepID=A0A6P1D549_9NOCA|nr:TetR/AcrR family transcriptional regulator [Nocardia cyriacigeorgica]NEW44200.1 TetR/AcrR family transcriptional regulator [Nocardia cyriacigeorgica]
MSTSGGRRGRPPGKSGEELLTVAREVYLERGFAGSTMDEIASRAGISKTSLYREHPSKAELFARVVEHWATAGRHVMRPALARLEAAEDVREELLAWARTLLAGILSPAVVEMRRLVTAEAARLPEVGAAYLHKSWITNIGDLATTLQTLDARGMLRIPDPGAAAEQLTWLVVGAPLNARMLDAAATPTDTVDSAIDLFLAAYHHDQPQTD